MTRIFLTATSFAALLLPACAAAQFSDQHQSNPPALDGIPALPRELVQLRALLLLDFPYLADMDELNTAIVLRDIVYENVPLGSTPGGFNYNSPVSSYVRSIHYGDAQICGGYSIIYSYALEAMGIQTRAVGMFREVDENIGAMDSHVSVEAYINGYWIAMDPTFNISFVDQFGRYLGWAEIRARYMNGEPVTATTNNMLVTPGQSNISTYYVSLAELTEHLSVGPGEPDAQVTHYGWNGVLTYSDGHTFDYSIQLGSNLNVGLASFEMPGAGVE